MRRRFQGLASTARIAVARQEQDMRIQDRYQLSFWDALIVAAARSASCRYLLTEDLQANQDLDGVLVVNPFLCDPGALPRT